jgi:hypothetical protein
VLAAEVALVAEGDEIFPGVILWVPVDVVDVHRRGLVL